MKKIGKSLCALKTAVTLLKKVNNDISKRKQQTSAGHIFEEGDGATKSTSGIRLTTFEILLVHQAKEILEKYIDDKPPSLKELSRMVGINELKLKTGFRAICNTSIYKWISTQKMVKAKDLVLNTNMPIKEISMLSGYSMVCNFITAFKKQHGCSPGKLRKEL
ncbi:AraC family transcriptional regulator [Niabella pedocola]|uniref:AraC family transcriptional regulator n=1 Tax=Niabella pedocola TaxID=1752077 RepID=A0ABS8PTI8_9BACT|nr:AraC family transcriptional regulator [Niabella pedocola]MCD2424396.1 AraC family transcriptional regulator [Niabella pedocola]